jgi:hypothetical protein
MFTTLTIAAAWFSFGYTVTDLLMTIAAKSKAGCYDERKD